MENDSLALVVDQSPSGADYTGNYATVRGGRYVMSVEGTGYDASHKATLQMKGPGGGALTLGTAAVATGTQAVDVPPGQVRCVITDGVSGAYVTLTRVGYN